MSMFFGKTFTQDGREFHVVGKSLICKVMGNLTGITSLGDLVVRPEWLKTDGEWAPPNMDFFLKMLGEFETWAGDNLTLIQRKTAITAAGWIATLYRNDSAYCPRIGWLALVIASHPDWDFGQLCDEYLKTEKRTDRLARYQMLVDYARRQYRKRAWVRASVDWGMAWIRDHGKEFAWQVPAEPGSDLSYYDPRSWPGNTPTPWEAVNGGRP